MKIAISQINTIIGDFAGNREKILEYTNKALANGADIVVFPELTLCGYPLLGLLEQDIFYEKTDESLKWLQKNLPADIAVLVGHVSKNRARDSKSCCNSISVIKNGNIIFNQSKTFFPSYDFFNEVNEVNEANGAKEIQESPKQNIFELNGIKIAIAGYEDLFRNSGAGSAGRAGTAQLERDKGVRLIIVPSSLPFFAGKRKIRFDLIRDTGKKAALPVVYVNSTGGSDNFVFDGNSMVIDNKGNLVLSAKVFEEELLFYDDTQKYESIEFKEDFYGDIEKAIIVGLRDYLVKCGFKKVHLGLSGGIDSALVAYLAVKAIGKENVKVFAMPSEFSSKGSVIDAQKLADNLGLKMETIPIKNIYDQFLKELEPFFKNTPFGLAEENLQARIRGALMMSYSNKWNSLLLATGNKSEISVGYCTLYGDTAGAVCIIGDLFKTDVFKLCRYINKRDGEIIPEAIISKPPSAELRPNQKDEDSLPPYDTLDKILELYILDNLSKKDIIKKGYDEKTVSFVISLVAGSEYKRAQAPFILKIFSGSFGTRRRAPLARKIYEN